MFDFCFGSLRFIGPGDSLGGWRKALGRMAAPRGLAADHPRHFPEGVVPGPSGEAWGREPHAVVYKNIVSCCLVLLFIVSLWSARGE